MNPWDKIKSLLNGNKRSSRILAIVLFAGLATALLIIVRAAGPFVALEGEEATNNGTLIKNNTSASGGQYIEYVGQTPPPPQTFSCTRILSMSQGRQTFEGMLATGRVPDGTWEAEITSGARLVDWVDPNFVGYNGNMIRTCSGAPEPDRIVFLFDPINSDWPADMHTVLDNIRFHHPQVKRVDLILLVGAEGDVICPSPIESGKTIRATTTHEAFQGRVEPVADAYNDVVMGPELEIPCNQYADSVGHMTDAGKLNVGVQMADWYDF